MKKIAAGVFKTEEAIPRLSKEVVSHLIYEAKSTPLQRARLCIHSDDTSLIQEMIIVLLNDTYVRPHKHLSREESFFILEGEATVLIFDEAGTVTEKIPLSPYNSGNICYFRMKEEVFHSVVITSEYAVVHEVVEGPFDRTKTVYAEWAPDSEERSEGLQFLKRFL